MFWRTTVGTPQKRWKSSLHIGWCRKIGPWCLLIDVAAVEEVRKRGEDVAAHDVCLPQECSFALPGAEASCVLVVDSLVSPLISCCHPLTLSFPKVLPDPACPRCPPNSSSSCSLSDSRPPIPSAVYSPIHPLPSQRLRPDNRLLRPPRPLAVPPGVPVLYPVLSFPLRAPVPPPCPDLRFPARSPQASQFRPQSSHPLAIA